MSIRHVAAKLKEINLKRKNYIYIKKMSKVNQSADEVEKELRDKAIKEKKREENLRKKEEYKLAAQRKAEQAAKAKEAKSEDIPDMNLDEEKKD